MPEYLAPGVFVEEVSYRSKSIEGVSTTTTGFVGPTRYGPVEIEPDVITNVTEFERVYGDGRQLDFGSEDGMLHNYLWHGVRAFFEEGGKRLYVSRTFRPSFVPYNKGYVVPPGDISDGAVLTDGKYGSDGHARLWATQATVAVAVCERTVGKLAASIQKLSNAIDVARTDSDAEATKETPEDTLPLLRAKQVVEIFGNDTTDKETGLFKALAAAKGRAIAAKGKFSSSTVSLDDVETEINDLKGKAGLAAAESLDKLDEGKVLVPAAKALHTSTTNALCILTEKPAQPGQPIQPGVGALAKSIAEDTTSLPPELKALAGALSNKCKAADTATNPSDAGGSIWQSFNNANSKAGDAESTYSVNAAKAALESVNKLQEEAKAVKREVEAITSKAKKELNQSLAATWAPTLDNLSKKADELVTETSNTLLAAHHSAYPRAFAIAGVAAKRDDLMTKLMKLEQQTTLTVTAVLNAPGNRVGAILLRARFPGAAGNSAIRAIARPGQNVLVADPNNSTKSRVRGVLPGDLVFIGEAGSSNTEANKTYLANPTTDGQDWHFGTDGDQANGKFSLNGVAGTKLDPNKHEVCIVTCQIDYTYPSGVVETWSGLALQPGHTRNGAADSITEKFTPAPKNGNDARTLPFVFLKDETIKNGRQVLGALLKIDPDDIIEKSAWPISATHQLAGGNDGKRPGAEEYAGRGAGPDAEKTGLKAFEDIEDISIVAAPGATFGYMNGYQSQAQQVVGKLISHAENMKYRIAVLESGNNQSIGDVRAMRARYDSKYAALYYPWVRVLDPITRDEIHLPPSGFVAGIYARNDIDRAVYKAPANEVVRGAIGFETLLNKAQQEVLNPEGINCFRFFEGRGFRLWGARTISSDPEWKYVNVRRYFAYLERSIDRGTQWAVFEPNGEALWANVRETISDFLYNEWKNGALLGSDPKSAYFVRCDRSTMTQNDLDNGRLICKIGVAALKPAEFVIFQIGQWTSDRKA